ncbi:LysR family transcriptional regulator [Companilactobacillus futsaii]|uniref:LysR family transcriptional regulator n=2 Tax=Companilactobacillus futsaii TaxID=938155 RepID=A0A5B7T133_9LACO|nr:LysR family transcriptional regulator [Companilactobacillus futsaii]KRK94123.1 transcriptional regulator [Companilactobacillus futsaii JCM 17355]QCX23975.1 LysR family transcriptional regulator [Companilactobacillus futsaii]
MFNSIATFQKVYETRNITKAAKELYVTQPSVSIQIKKLEKDLGVQLFKRNGNKGLIPTENANRFYRDSQIIMNSWENSMNHLVKKHRSNRIKCVIGVSHTTSNLVLPPLMVNLKKYFTKFDFEIVAADSEKVLEEITKREIDFGIIEKPIVTHEIEQTAFTSNELVLAGNLESPEWIIGKPGSPQHEFSDKYFNEHHMRPTRVIKVNDNNLILNLITRKIGKAIISKRAIRDTLIPYEQLSSDFSNQFYLINPKVASSDETQKLIAWIKTLLPQLKL